MGELVPTIAVDFDGVIHAYSGGWKDGTIYDPPMPGALDGLRTLMETNAVFIHTARAPYPVAQWLEEHGIPAVVELNTGGRLRDFWTEREHVLVTNRKLPAVAYLDDRAVRFTSWPQALRELLPTTEQSAVHARIVQALTDAWPALADDPVHVDQLAEVAYRAIEEATQ